MLSLKSISLESLKYTPLYEFPSATLSERMFISSNDFIIYGSSSVPLPLHLGSETFTETALDIPPISHLTVISFALPSLAESIIILAFSVPTPFVIVISPLCSTVTALLSLLHFAVIFLFKFLPYIFAVNIWEVSVSRLSPDDTRFIEIILLSLYLLLSTGYLLPT